MKDPFASRWGGVGTGGSTALDFVNTLDWRLRPKPEESLRSYIDVLRWAWSAGLLTGQETHRLLEWAGTHPRQASHELTHAKRFREALAALFGNARDGKRLEDTSLSVLNASVREGAAHRGLRNAGRSAEWTWQDDPPSPRRLIWAVAAEAARVLTSSEREQVRQCGDAQCGWFFLDTSRNRTRRWCSMETCGNRNKARSFYRRKRKGT